MRVNVSIAGPVTGINQRLPIGAPRRSRDDVAIGGQLNRICPIEVARINLADSVFLNFEDHLGTRNPLPSGDRLNYVVGQRMSLGPRRTSRIGTIEQSGLVVDVGQHPLQRRARFPIYRVLRLSQGY